MKGNVRCPVAIVAAACKQRPRKDKFRGCECVCVSSGKRELQSTPPTFCSRLILKGPCG